MKKNLYLFQPQYSIKYNNNSNYWVPYSAGCIWSYAKQFKDINDNINLDGLIFRREPISQIMPRMQNPQICAFSNYIWNEKWNLNAAREIKNRWPDCVIMFGGPQTHVNYLNKHSFVDCVISGEGEEAFVDFLRCIILSEPYERTYSKKRLDDLDIPSPYLSGVFDRIMQENPDAVWNMTWETNRGCPYACTFCDWGGVTYSKVKKFPMERIKAEIEWIANHKIGYVFIADANFGAFKSRDLEIARMLKEVSNRSTLDSINIQFAKNSSEVVYEIGKILGDLNRGITMSVQSMNDETLEHIKRKNLPSNNVRHLMDLSEKNSVPTYTEVIIGLPLETLDSWKEGLANILEMGQHNSIDVWFAQLLVNSELGQPESKERYKIKTVVAKDYFPQFDPNDWREIVEEIEIISETSTMSTSDIVTGYLYAWMYIQFHNSGYSQLHAKYCRTLHDVSYFNFYECFFDLLKKEEWLQDHFKMMSDTVDHYLRHGDLLDLTRFKNGGLGHGLHSISYPFMYKNRHKCFDLAAKVTRHFIGQCPQDLDILQRLFIFDLEQLDASEIDLSFDPVNWQPVKSKISIECKLDQEFLEKIKKKIHAASYQEIDDDRLSFDFYAIRRKGWLKNNLQLLDLHIDDVEMPVELGSFSKTSIPILSLT